MRTTIRRPVYQSLTATIDYSAIEHFVTDSPEIEQEGESLLNEMDSVRWRIAAHVKKLIESRIETITWERNSLAVEAQKVEEQGRQHQDKYGEISAAFNRCSDLVSKANVEYQNLRRYPPQRSTCTDHQWSAHEETLNAAGKELDKAQADLLSIQNWEAQWRSQNNTLRKQHEELVQRVESLDHERLVLQGCADPERIISDPGTGMPLHGTGTFMVQKGSAAGLGRTA